ncbi:hypothetical protein [Alkalicoccus halolimnae]|uniref:Uncharacterized protein n=1 Tax=Alkalicoccus halolimnae TaxID=1667239 RepID=A0A5C7FLR2_9BACI|nr:hypothetical protein [Alkalicoccus halolimnae]TXF87304.1 hypothetical protein FTX54_00855 [Alkalicoccus halolimnae]
MKIYALYMIDKEMTYDCFRADAGIFTSLKKAEEAMREVVQEAEITFDQFEIEEMQPEMEEFQEIQTYVYESNGRFLKSEAA